MIELKTPAEIDAMARAGRITAAALAAVRDAARVGVRLAELDAVAADVIASAGAEPLFRGYHPSWAPVPYPGVVCLSVNDAVVHGIPGDYALAPGDLVSADCGARYQGWSGDAAITFTVGDPPAHAAVAPSDPARLDSARSDPAGLDSAGLDSAGLDSARSDPARPGLRRSGLERSGLERSNAARADAVLIETAWAALTAGIEAARPGARLGDIAHAIGSVARAAGYGMPAGYGGHGIGREMHEAPSVPNEGRPGRGLVLRPGLVLALEPMLIAGGTDAHRLDPDGWTVRTADGSRAAHVEHTVAITPTGPRVLTAAVTR